MKFKTLVPDIITCPDDVRASEQPRTWLRTVDVPDEDIFGSLEEDILPWIFKFGQNDFQQRCAPSLSMGDLIILDFADGWQVHRVEAIGFKRVEDFELCLAERNAVSLATSNAWGEMVDNQAIAGELAIHARGGNEHISREEAVEDWRGKVCRWSF